MSKNFRQEQIRKLVRSRPVRSQTELAEALRRAGVETTQVTLSRDLKQLGLVKTPSGYAELGTVEGNAGGAAANDLARIVGEFVRDVRPAQNLLVLKTDAGAAPRVAAALDAAHWREVAGSLAGDDTVLLVCDSPRRRFVIEQRVRDLLAGSRSREGAGG